MKKTYLAPIARVVELDCENIMIVNSPLGYNDALPQNMDSENPYQTGGYEGGSRSSLWGED